MRSKATVRQIQTNEQKIDMKVQIKVIIDHLCANMHATQVNSASKPWVCCRLCC